MQNGEFTDQITPREKEVLRLVVSELTTTEISVILRISSRTVETHRKNIIKKLNSKSLVALTKYAIMLGMIDDFIYTPSICKKTINTRISGNSKLRICDC
jgi:DNA-binding CsgD family transcriptional regulator